MDQRALRLQLQSLGKVLPLPPTLTKLELFDGDPDDEVDYDPVDIAVLAELLRCPSFAKLERVHFSEWGWARVTMMKPSGEFLAECEKRELVAVGRDELRCGHDWRHDPEELSEDDEAGDSEDSEARSKSRSEDDG